MPYKDPEKQRAAQAASFQRNKEKYRETNAHRNRTMFAMVKEAKNAPCADCKIKYPYYVMQFDHIGVDKVRNIAAMSKTCSIQTVKNEIAKCEVVCANCHMTRTWSRLQETT